MAQAQFIGNNAVRGFQPKTIQLTLETADELKALFAIANWTPTAQLFSKAGAAQIRNACREAGFAPVLRRTETAWLRKQIRDQLKAAGERLDD